MPTVELVDRGTVAYCLTGDGARTVVLVNGSVFNYHQWDRQGLPILQRALGGRCRFLQYDYVGIGGSSAKTKPFRMLDLADELRDLLDALSIGPVHLLGISKGSLVGQAFLIRHRERVKSFCGLGNPSMLSDRLAPTLATYQERIDVLEGLREYWSQRIDPDNIVPIFNKIYVPSMFGKQYEELSLVERLRAFFVRRMVYPALEGTHVRAMVDLFRYYVGDISQEVPAFAEGLPQIRDVPILLLNGTSDTTTPVHMSRQLADLLPGAKLIEFEGVTHMGPMLLAKEARPVFGQYVAFLERLLQGSG